MRCSCCDYTRNDGAGSIGVSPGQYGQVRRYGDEFLCDTCIETITQNYVDLCKQGPEQEETDDYEQLDEDASALSLWQKQ